jgi:hypothetical protein
VIRTRLELLSAGAQAVIDVHYADEEKLGLLVPARMTEMYSLGQRTAGGGAIDPFDRLHGAPVKLLIDGRATYADYRRFSVETKTIIK